MIAEELLLGCKTTAVLAACADDIQTLGVLEVERSGIIAVVGSAIDRDILVDVVGGRLNDLVVPVGLRTIVRTTAAAAELVR